MADMENYAEELMKDAMDVISFEEEWNRFLETVFAAIHPDQLQDFENIDLDLIDERDLFNYVCQLPTMADFEEIVAFDAEAEAEEAMVEGTDEAIVPLDEGVTLEPNDSIKLTADEEVNIGASTSSASSTVSRGTDDQQMEAKHEQVLIPPFCKALEMHDYLAFSCEMDKLDLNDKKNNLDNVNVSMQTNNIPRMRKSKIAKGNNQELRRSKRIQLKIMKENRKKLARKAKRYIVYPK
uniref:Uncharacterized protein n=1 Tax=Anopheles funestus TaxID=62324 RepID=A0A182RKC4_ANOFN